MSAVSFEFRVCQNPDCGLRYPVQRGNPLGIRCPMCLGKTTVMEERTAKREDGTDGQIQPDADVLSCLLDNVRSALNVGSIFRSAEGYGFGHLYLCGITPTPESPRIAKTGLSAERTVPWSVHRDAVELVRSLKQKGCRIWALERTADARAIETVASTDRQTGERILIVGNEQAGVDPGILSLADEVVHLEMRGRKQSFNVAVAFAVAAHVLRNSRT